MIRFSPAQRGLHWLMAVMIVTMLFVGVGMVSTVSESYTALLSLHRPLGIAVLVLALARIVLRLVRGAPPLPDDLPAVQKLAAGASHLLLYGLMVAMPLIGWAMLSAGGYPIVLFGGVHLPPIMPHDDALQAVLHTAHVWLGFLFYAVILAHLAAALFHALVRRDGVFQAMAGGRVR